MKVFLVSLLTLFVCRLGRCDLEKHFDNNYKFAVKSTPATSSPCATDELNPLHQSWWIKELTSLDKKGYARAYGPNYFKNYQGRKLKEGEKKPIDIIDDEIKNLEKTGPQYSLYRCMKETEAKEMGIIPGEYKSYKPGVLNMDKVTGHIGHCGQALEYAKNVPGNALIEFKLIPNAHKLLFSPKVAAIGTKSHKTAVIAETAKVRGEGYYVVKESVGEGYVDGFVGIKSEDGDYYSLAMAANKVNKPGWNNAKTLISKLTEKVTRINFKG